MNCEKCQKETFLPFKCPYCGGHFCSEHRLPENHECQRMGQARMPKEENPPLIVQEQKPYEHTVTFTPTYKTLHFSRKEIGHLLVGALLVAGVGASMVIYQFYNDYMILALMGLISTTSFFLHEIAHKIVAQREGLWAEFRLTLMGAILTLVSILPTFFKIISPGAVMISGFPDSRKLAKTSIAGPVTNIALSLAFFAVAFLLPKHAFALLFGAALNAWIAFFNLIPLGMLDGFKIFVWNKRIWAVTFALSMVLTLASYKLVTY